MAHEIGSVSARPIIRDVTAWRNLLANEKFELCPYSTACGVFLVSPDGFSIALESATDNVYMATGKVDQDKALIQHANLASALSQVLPVKVFLGNAETPDAVFPNNVFATTPGKLIVGAMRHQVRRREARRTDIPEWFKQRHGYHVERLDDSAMVAELTGPLIIDHARNLAYCGLSERVDQGGIEAMHAALGLRATFVFQLQPGEYHTNVVMSVLAGRVLVIHAGSFVDPEVPAAIAALYGNNVVWLSDAEKFAFCGNCIALAQDQLWMSAQAASVLSTANRRLLEHAGFTIRSVDLSEIEKAGGSLRCCVAEIW